MLQLKTQINVLKITVFVVVNDVAKSEWDEPGQANQTELMLRGARRGRSVTDQAALGLTLR